MLRFRRLHILTHTVGFAAAFLGFVAGALPASANRIFPQATAPQALRSIPRSHAALAAGTMPLVYVCDYAGTVLAYDATFAPNETTQTVYAPVETIVGLSGPTGLAVDAAGDLYVVEATANDIKVFAPGALKPFKTLAGIAGAHAFQIALDGNGTVYVATNTNKIAVYRNGATTPSALLSDPSIANIVSLAADRVGNLFVSYVTQARGVYTVGAFPATISEGAGLFAPLPELSGMGTPFQLAVDPGGNLLVGDIFASNQFNQGHISFYRPANPVQAGAFGFDDGHGRERFVLNGTASANIFVAPESGHFIAMQNFPGGLTDIEYILPSTFTTWSIAAYPAAPLGTW